MARDESTEDEEYIPGGEDDGYEDDPEPEPEPRRRRQRVVDEDEGGEDPEEEVERPRRRREPVAEDPDDGGEDDPPSRRRRRDEDEEIDDDPPTRVPDRARRRARDEDEEEERPRVARRHREDDEDDDRPRRRVVAKKRPAPEGARASGNGRRRRVSPGNGGGVRRGWSAGNKTMEANRRTGDFAKAYQDTPSTQIVKFLEDEPYANYAQHWVARVDSDGKKVNRPYVCLGTVDEACPLCDILGDKPQAISAFNIAVLDDDGEVTHLSWNVGPRLFDDLKSFREDPKIRTLTKGFWASRRSGKGFQTRHHVVPVRSKATLLEDYEVEAPDDEVYDAVDLYEAEIVKLSTYKELEEIAEEMVDADDYD